MKVLAPELDLYQDEPRQLPTGALGKDALLRLRFEARHDVGSSRVDLQACKLEYSIVSPK